MKGLLKTPLILSSPLPVQVFLSLLGAYCKHKAAQHNVGTLLCVSTSSLAALSALLSLIPFNGSEINTYLVLVL